MDSHDVQLVGGPCGQHGPYTFYKAFKYTKGGVTRIVTLSEFFFVKMWRDSDLLCIGELQLLWADKNSESTLASLRLYFLPENTPEGRMDHGEDEVLAISEKVVLRVDDLATWITAEAEWTWGRRARCAAEVDAAPRPTSPPCASLNGDDEPAPPKRPAGSGFGLQEGVLDLAEVDVERKQLESQYDESEFTRPYVVILSFPKYCRYRAMMKRLENVEDQYLKLKVVNALGGFYVTHPNTRVLFCRDTFDYPELEGHEMLCNHLAPKLKGRPRGKRKKRSVSPCSESNESESSASNHYTRVADRDRTNSLRSDSPLATRRSVRCHEHNENKQFLRVLTDFMRAKRLPMGRIPSLGYKELNLHEFYTKVQKLGGYEAVTTNKLWKNIFDDITGHLNSTSATTVIRRHYERFLLAFEKNERGEEYNPPVAERRRINSRRRRSESSNSDSISSSEESNLNTPAPSSPPNTPQPQETNKEPTTPGKPSSLRSVRVKPERQKERKEISAKENEESEVKPKIEKLIIKTESMTIVTSPTVKTESPIFDAKIQSPVFVPDMKTESPIFDAKIQSPVFVPDPKTETPVFVTDVKTETESTVFDFKIECNNDKKCETNEQKEVEVDIKIEIKKSEDSVTMISNHSEKDPEPSMGQVAPIPEVSPEKISAENNLSPVEGKENIPSESNNMLNATEIPTNEGNSVFKQSGEVNNVTNNVKKIRLDILKEGGLEVTPVKSNLSPTIEVKDVRPSVIQPTAQIITKPLKTDMMPPPQIVIPKRSQILPPVCSPIKIPTTSPKNKVDLFNFNGTMPPKVVQSNSIYTYSEKKVYGNPKDFLQENISIKQQIYPVATSKVPGAHIKGAGIEAVDLSVTSPQKPIVEITRVAQNIVIPQKNIYKTPSSQFLDGKRLDGCRLGTNLEITLVRPKNNINKTNNNFPHSISHANHIKYPTLSPSKRPSNDFPNRTSKSLKIEENGRYKTIPSIPKLTSEINIPHPFSDTHKPSAQYHKPPVAPVLPPMPPYMNQFPQENGMASFFSLDSLYYQAMMQSLSSGAVPPMVPLVPNAQQLKLYAELIARSGINPFNLPHEGIGKK